jgi:hypothetical protein
MLADVFGRPAARFQRRTQTIPRARWTQICEAGEWMLARNSVNGWTGHAWILSEVRRLAIPTIALARFNLGGGFAPAIGGQRFPDVIGFFELPAGVAPHKTFVGSSFDQFTFSHK